MKFRHYPFFNSAALYAACGNPSRRPVPGAEAIEALVDFGDRPGQGIVP